MYFNCEICGKKIDGLKNDLCEHYKHAIYTSDRKYLTLNDNGKVYVYRNGERWTGKEQDLIGDGYVLSLIHHIEDLQDELRSCYNKINKENKNDSDVDLRHANLKSASFKDLK